MSKVQHTYRFIVNMRTAGRRRRCRCWSALALMARNICKLHSLMMSIDSKVIILIQQHNEWFPNTQLAAMLVHRVSSRSIAAPRRRAMNCAPCRRAMHCAPRRAAAPLSSSCKEGLLTKYIQPSEISHNSHKYVFDLKCIGRSRCSFALRPLPALYIRFYKIQIRDSV